MGTKNNELNIAAQSDEYLKNITHFGEEDPSDIVKDIIKLKKTGTVLDLGVGYGRNALFLARQGFSVVGVDTSELAISRFREFAEGLGVEVRGIVEDMAKFKFDKKYDVILSIATLNLIKREEANELIQKIKVNTEDGGLNAISVFTELVPSEGISFLYKKNELKNIYRGWQIINYNEHRTSIHKHENWPPHRHTNANLLTRKT